MKIIKRVLVIYALLGVITWADWHFVWLKGTENSPPPWDRATVSMFFGPLIALTWPLSWVSFYDLGAWSYLPSPAAKMWREYGDPYDCFGSSRYEAMSKGLVCPDTSNDRSGK